MNQNDCHTSMLHVPQFSEEIEHSVLCQLSKKEILVICYDESFDE